jgi:hypothetical protein
MTAAQTAFTFDDPKRLSRKDAEERRDDGMARAEQHAEAEIPKWKDLALDALCTFVSSRANPFLTEDFRVWTIATNACPQPPEPRAWGAVMSAAKARGLVTPCGTGRAATSNLSPKVLWQRA